MARGKLLKTKVKEAVLEASCVAEAVKIGSLKAENKVHESKSMLDSAREHIGKMIDRIDPLEVAAVAGLTFVLHETILSTSDLIQKINTTIAKNPAYVVGVLNPFAGLMLSLLPKMNFPDELDNIKTPDSFFLWVVSFLLAFIIIRHGAELVKGGVGSVSSLLPLIGMI